MVKKLFGFIIAFLFAFAPVLSANTSNLSLTKEAKGAFRWLDRMRFPDVAGKKLVLVSTGHWVSSNEGPRRNTWIYGFLLSQDSNSFNVLALDLREQAFQRTPPNTPEYERQDYEVVDLAQNAERYFRFLKHPEGDKDLRERLAGGYFNDRASLFVMAWGCWKNGLIQLAQSLYEQAQTIEKPEDNSRKQPEMRELLEKDFGHGMIWVTTLAAGENLSVSRLELLKRFERISKYCPGSEYAEQAGRLVKILKRMILEDESHRAKPLENISIEEKVSELIYQLREQHGFQISQPGSCDIFRDPRGEESPAHQLVKIGLPAVPQLIKALDDERLTRSMEFGRNFYFSHYILRNGDAALAILERIARRSFCDSSRDECSLRMVKEVGHTRDQAMAWWQDMRAKGEPKLLEESVAGDEGTLGQARLLSSKYPAAALPAIWHGIQNASKEWHRTGLVEVMGEIPGDAPVPFLLQEMKSSPFLDARVAAAHAIFQRGRPEAVPAMIQEWQQRLESDNYLELESLSRFLAWCDRSEAVRALASNILSRSIKLRSNMIEAFDDKSMLNIFANDSLKKAIPQNGLDGLSKPVRAEIEKFLITELEDIDETDDQLGMIYPFEQRLCDKAGAILSKHWPDKYRFDASSSQKMRELQRLECMNIWRKSQEMQTLASPAQRPPAENPNEVVEVTFIRSIPNPDLELASNAMAGKILTSDDFFALMLKFIQTEPERISRVRIQARRDEDLTGVRIIVGFERNKLPLDKVRQRFWNNTTRVTIDRDSIHADLGSGKYEYLTTSKAYAKFKNAIDKALNSKAQSPFLITASFSPGEDPEETRALLKTLFDKPKK